jgi:DNA-binding beta-propeller fold protein YncE
MKSIKTACLFFAFTVLFLFSCTKSESDPASGTYIESGSAIIVNEGNFGSNNGSVSYISRSGAVTNFIFELSNAGVNLGDVVQSYTRVGNKGILCVNNSQKIEIVDARTFKRLATLSDAVKTAYVRYGLEIDENKAYVSNGNFEGAVQVIDMNSYTITKSIPVGKGPEQMVKSGENIYVCNSGGFDVDSTISVINSTSETVTSTFTVGDIPVKMVKDAQNYIWVLCAGKTDFSAWPDITKLSASKLVRINTVTNTIDKSFTLIAAGNPSYVVNLAIGNNGRTIYYSISDEIFSLEITDGSLPASPVISGRSFYGLAASPFSNQIWGLSAPDFTSSGYVFRFSASGSLLDSLKVGIGPNSAVFNF